MYYNIYNRNIYEILGKSANVKSTGMSVEEKKKIFEMGEKSGTKKEQANHQTEIEKYSFSFKSFQENKESELQEADTELEKAKKELSDLERITDLKDEDEQEKLQERKRDIEILKENAKKQKAEQERLKKSGKVSHDVGMSRGLKIGRLEGLLKTVTPIIARSYSNISKVEKLEKLKGLSTFYDDEEKLAYLGIKNVEDADDLGKKIIIKHRKYDDDVDTQILPKTYYKYNDKTYDEHVMKDKNALKEISDVETNIAKKELQIYSVEKELDEIKTKKLASNRRSNMISFDKELTDLENKKKILETERVELYKELSPIKENYQKNRMGAHVSKTLKEKISAATDPLDTLFKGLKLGTTAKAYPGIKIAKLYNPVLFSDENIYKASTKRIKELLSGN